MKIYSMKINQTQRMTKKRKWHKSSKLTSRKGHQIDPVILGTWRLATLPLPSFDSLSDESTVIKALLCRSRTRGRGVGIGEPSTVSSLFAGVSLALLKSLSRKRLGSLFVEPDKAIRFRRSNLRSLSREERLVVCLNKPCMLTCNETNK